VHLVHTLLQAEFFIKYAQEYTMYNVTGGRGQIRKYRGEVTKKSKSEITSTSYKFHPVATQSPVMSSLVLGVLEKRERPSSRAEFRDI
jgi:hypothetical protein